MRRAHEFVAKEQVAALKISVTVHVWCIPTTRTNATPKGVSSDALGDGLASTQVDGPPAPCRGRVSRGARSRTAENGSFRVLSGKKSGLAGRFDIAHHVGCEEHRALPATPRHRSSLDSGAGRPRREGAEDRRLTRADVLILDDWCATPLTQAERKDMSEIMEDRYGERSTIVITLTANMQ